MSMSGSKVGGGRLQHQNSKEKSDLTKQSNGLNYDLAQVADLRYKRDPNIIIFQSRQKNQTFTDQVENAAMQQKNNQPATNNDYK